MNKFFASLLAAGVVALSAVAVQAMPFGGDRTQDSLIIPVAGGCGAGFHRGPAGGCRRNGYYGGVYYGTPAVVVPGPVVVAPGPYFWNGRYYHNRHWYHGGWRYY
jgi:hypothetical protein